MLIKRFLVVFLLSFLSVSAAHADIAPRRPPPTRTPDKAPEPQKTPEPPRSSCGKDQPTDNNTAALSLSLLLLMGAGITFLRRASLENSSGKS